MAPYLAPRLSKTEVESLERKDLEVLLPHLTSEQKEWVTLRQFQTYPYYRDGVKKEIAPYLASKLSKTEVESLEGRDLEILQPHLTSEQKNGIGIGTVVESFREKLKEILSVF